MRIKRVVESQIWVNKKTKETASIYGAVPYYYSNKQDWIIKKGGYLLETYENTIIGLKSENIRDAYMKLMDNRGFFDFNPDWLKTI